MDTELQESVDFDFFETPRSATKDAGDTSTSSPVSKSKPPVRPGTAKTTPKDDYDKKDEGATDKGRRSSSSRNSRAEYSSDNVSDSEDSKDDKSPSRDAPKRRHQTASKSSSRSSSVSSCSSDSYSSSDSDRSESHKYSQKPRRPQSGSKVNRSRHSSGSDSDSGPRNSTGKKEETSLPKRGKSRQGEDEYSSSAFSDGEDSSANKSREYDGKGNGGRSQDSVKNEDKRQAWGETKEGGGKSSDKGSRNDRPKTAKVGRKGKNSDRYRESRSWSGTDTLSDSDITDVSPMDSPRNGFQSRYKDSKGDKSHVTAAGDGRHVKAQFRALPLTELDLKDRDDDHVPDKNSGLDLDILMKAVGELEKQKRLQANSRRVMFAPMTLKRGEKANYTFDESKTRDIERENQRLLKEIVRRVHSGDQKKQFYRSPTSYKLTASAVNRDKEIRRIETENLAFLRRLQKVKPTKTICRDHQLREYETTTLHGVPIAALHPLPKAGRRSVMSDSTSSIGSRTRSMTSINSATSSVRSGGSRRSSRPSSASKRPGSATKRVDSRPEWSDRW